MSQPTSVTPVPGENRPEPSSNASDSTPPAAETTKYLHLRDRVPTAAAVVDVVKSDLEVRNMLEYTEFFRDEKSQAVLLDVDYWETIGVTLVNAIMECAAGSHKELQKMNNLYMQKKAEILEHIGRFDLYGDDDAITQKQRHEAARLRMLLGMHFFSEFQKLVKSAWGKEVRSIPEQVQAEVEAAGELEIGALFGGDRRLAEHVYYVIGFICNSGKKESKRRSEKGDVGKCIAEACSHHLSAGDAGLEELKEKLPTRLVDRRMAMGGLKYPDEAFYRLFAVVEQTFSKVATLDNFLVQGSHLIAKIRYALAHNEKLLERFTALLGEGTFSDETICEAFGYFVKVFSNMRAKDLALKYNSNLNGSNTVGLRQTLAGGIALGKKKRKAWRGKQSKSISDKAEGYSAKTVSELKELCRQRKLHVSGIKSALVARLEGYDAEQSADGDEEEGGAESEEEGTPELESAAGEKMDDEGEHQMMLEAFDEADLDAHEDFSSAEKVSDRDIIANNVDKDMDGQTSANPL